MTNSFNCVATSIGSMPTVDPESAVKLSFQYLPEAPFWPQLPQRDFREQMHTQYSESLPGLKIDREGRKVWIDTTGDFAPAFEIFFERYLARDYGFFRITETYAPGFYAFLRALQNEPLSKLRYVKGHITGPLTLGTSFKDETGKDIIHNEMFFDALVKGLAMKALWQIEELKQFGKPVVIFIDEPSMESLGSAFCAVSSQVVAEKLDEIIDAIHELGGLAGIHCCGNADWAMIFNTKADIVNFDAFAYMNKVLLYPGDIKKFLGRGGALAWGIVPTGAFTGNETAELLVSKLEAGFQLLRQEGIALQTILRQSLLTPSCGMGSLTMEKAEAILKLLREVSDRLQSLRTLERRTGQE